MNEVILSHQVAEEKIRKMRFLFFSIGRTTMRQCALERSMSQVYQTIFFMSIDWFPASLHQLKVGKYW